MGKIVEIPYRVDIIKYVTDIVYRDGKNIFDDYVVVFPGKRPALYVRKLLYERLKSGFVPPFLFSMDEFIEKSYSGDCSIMKTNINLVWMLYNSIKNDLKGFGFNDEFVNFLPWGYKIVNLIEELDIERVNIEGKYYYPRELPAYIEQIVINIGKIREKFHKYIEKKGYITRDMLYADVVSNGDYDWLDRKKIIFAGFFALTKSEKQIVSKLIKEENFEYIIQRESDNWKHFIDTVDVWKKGNEIEYIRNSEISPDAKISVTSAFDDHSEIVGVSNILSRVDNKSDIAVVLPDSSQLFPLLNIVMDGVDIPYNITMGYPLTRSPLYSMFNIIFQLQENKSDDRYYVADFVKLLFHPYIKNIKYGDSDSFVRIIFENIRFEINKEKLFFITKDDLLKLIENKTFRNLFSLEGFEQYSEGDIKTLIEELFSLFIEPFSRIESLEALSKAVESVLHFMHKNTIFENYLLNKKFVVKLLELIDSVKSAEIAREKLGYRVVLNVFRKMCEYENVPFIGSPLRPFQIMGLLETRNLIHERVILLDVNEGILPSDDINDPLIPQGLRKVLNLPTYESRLEIYKYYFNRILKSSKYTDLLYIKNADKERSRFIEGILWKSEKESGKAGKIKHRINEIKFNIPAREESNRAIEKNDKIIEFLHSMEFSASSINMYIHCPYRFYLNKVLNIEEEEEADEEFDRRDVGIFVHKAMEFLFSDKNFVQMTKRYKYNYKNIKRLIERYAEKAFEEKVGKKVGEKLLLFETAKMAIESYVWNFAKGVDSDFNVVATEAPLKGNIIVKNREIKLKGFADRIDSIGNKIVINDYKTGGEDKIPKLGKLTEIKEEDFDREIIKKNFSSVQLPLYVYLYNQMYPDYDFESIDAQLIMLRNKNINKMIKSLFSEEGQNRVEFIEEKFLPVLRFIIEEITDKNIGFVPDHSDDNYCKYCPYNKICK